ncbi:MAG: hypothetical protein NVS3B10_22360 [Polyangiales bacterium]
MEKAKAPTTAQLDIRVLQRNLLDGTLSAADLKSHIAALPDLASKAETVQTTLSNVDEPDLDDDDAQQD